MAATVVGALVFVVIVLLALSVIADGAGESRSTVEFGPDLAVNAGEVTLSKPVLLSGVPFNVTVKVHNLGDEDATEVTVDLLVDAEPADRVGIESLPVDGWEVAKFGLTLVEGDYEIGILVDADDSIDERREDNNGASVPVRVRGLPDAAVTDDDLTVSDPHPMEGDVITVSALVHNLGESAATLVVVQFWDGTPGEGELIANRTTSVPEAGQQLVSTQWDTTGMGGTHELSIVIARVLPGEEELGNNLASVTVLVFTQWDLVIDSVDKTIDQPYLQDGFVTVRGGAKLTIEHINFTFQQDYANQFALFVEDGGYLVLNEATVKSDQPLLVILEDGTSMTLGPGSTLMATVLTDGDVTISVDASLIVGGLRGNATRVTLTDSEVSGPVELGSGLLVLEGSTIVSDTPCKLSGTRAFLLDSTLAGMSARSLELSGGASAELRNVSCSDVLADEESKALVFRRVEVLVVDESTLVIPGASVEVRQFINGSVVASGVGGEDGRTDLEVLSDVIEGGESHFVGNYLVFASFSTEEATEPLLLKPFPAMDAAANLPKATVVLPPIEPRHLVATTSGDMVVKDGERTDLVADYIQDGNIIVQGTLTVSSATLSILQDRDHQFFVVVEGDGRLELQGGGLVSGHPVNVYLYDDACLFMGPGSSLHVNALVAKEGATFEAHGSSIDARLLLRGGPVSLMEGCHLVADLVVVEVSALSVEGGTMEVDVLRVDSPAVAIKSIAISAEEVNVTASFANVSDSTLSVSRLVVDATILTVRGSSITSEEALDLDVATLYMDTSSTNVPLTGVRSDSKVYLYDAEVPRPFHQGNATVLVYWYLTTVVQDILGNPVADAPVEASYTNNGTKMAIGTTNDDGEVRFPLLGSIVGPEGEYFIGNYRVIIQDPDGAQDQLVRYVNLDRAKTLIVSFEVPMVPPTMLGLDIAVDNTTVLAGTPFNVTGSATAIFPTLRSALSEGDVELRLWNNDTSWSNETALGEDGLFGFQVPAPNETGVYYLKAVVTPTGVFAGVGQAASNIITMEVVPRGPEWLFIVLQPDQIDGLALGGMVLVAGTVYYDSASGEPVPEARVFVEDPISKQMRQTTADGLGVFELRMAGPKYYGVYPYPVTAKDDETGLETEAPVKLVVITSKTKVEQEDDKSNLLPIILIVVIVVVAVVGGVMAYWTLATKGRMVECGECGTLVPETATECPKCGIEFEVEVAKCSVCESWIKASAEVCPYCNTPFKEVERLEEDEEGAEGPGEVGEKAEEDLEVDLDESEMELQVPPEAVKQVPPGLKKEVRPRPVVQRRTVKEAAREPSEEQAAEDNGAARPRVRKVASPPPPSKEDLPADEREDKEES